MKINKIFGNKAFYKAVIIIALPIMLQQGLTSIVSLLDNVMVGSISEDALAGVAVSNQILFVYNYIILGGLAGPGIFISQYYGSGDDERLRQSFRFKLIIVLIITFLSLIILVFFKENIIKVVFSNDEVNEELAINEAVKYINVMLYSLPFYAISQVLSTSLREVGKTVIPMISGIAGIITNVILNYCLIYGNFIFPELGVEGAAIATTISRFVEMAILIFIVLYRKMVFVKGNIFSLYINKELFKTISKKGIPLLINEALWSLSLTIIVFCYAVRGKDVINAISIATVIVNFTYIVINGLVSAISIFVGKELGANKIEEAKDNAYKLMVFSVLVAFTLGLIFSIIAPYIRFLYVISDEASIIAKKLIYVVCFCMPISAYYLSSFFTIRAGGKCIYTLICDSIFQVVIVLPFAYVMCNLTNVNIILIYLLVQCFDIIKGTMGLFIIKYANWANNLTMTM